MRYLILLTGLLLAQKTFEGTVVYSTRFEGEMAKQLADMLRDALPERVVVHYRGNRTRADMGEMVAITDLSAKKIYVLRPSLQTYSEQTIEDEQKDDTKKPELKKTKEKTKILGYPVDKYEATVESEQGPVKVEIWATPQFQAPQGVRSPIAQGFQVPGFPLKVVSRVPGVDLQIVFFATEISQKVPEEELFRIPAGYVREETSTDEQD